MGRPLRVDKCKLRLRRARCCDPWHRISGSAQPLQPPLSASLCAGGAVRLGSIVWCGAACKGSLSLDSMAVPAKIA